MPHPHDSMRFARIETRAVMANGKVVTSWNSYPLGVGKDEYDRIEAAMVRAFGSAGTSVVGTPVGHPNLTVERPWRFPAPAAPSLAEGEVALVSIVVEDGDGAETIGLNHTVAGAVSRVLDQVAGVLEERGVPLTDAERAALAATLTRDWSLQLDGDIVSPCDIERGRLLEIGACVEAGYEIRAQAVGD